MGSNPSPTDNPAAPVTRVTYNDVQKFLKKLSKATGVPFRLPTEAEWEYAARQREDMVGNAWEWCSDRWIDDLGSMLTVNPAGTTEGDARALRGGSALEKNNKPITRKAMAATSRAGDVGLRLAVTTGEPYPAEIYDVLVSNKVQRESFDGTDFKNETFTVGGVVYDFRGYTYKSSYTYTDSNGVEQTLSSILQAHVVPAGTGHLTLYYVANDNTSYIVNHYLVRGDGTIDTNDDGAYVPVYVQTRQGETILCSGLVAAP